MIKVLPSSNPEKEENLVEYARTLESLGVEYLHCDVMDGVFVENKCLSIDVIEKVRNNSNILLDVHLMVIKPEKTIQQYISYKPNIITIHYESLSVRKIKKLSKVVRKKDILFGVSIKPSTPVTALVELLDYIDLILIMSVEPGKSGQVFIDDALDKIRDTKILCKDRNIIIEVDGGINLKNYKAIVDAGAEFLVMGSAFYKESDRAKLLSKINSHYISDKSKN
jgi:ribulose-phosphate 3-epimerase